MKPNPITRRLVAIVVADVVGYTRLMEHDEGGTHARLHEIRDQVVDPEIAALGGRIVKTAGDGMLVEFGSAAAALRFAIEVQRAMSARNQPLAPDERIQFRIGINLGDIIVDGSDIAGDGVNIAARLETLSEPGGICVSAAVRDQIHEDLSVEFTDIGEQHVKNIARPIRVYRVAPRTGAYQQPSRRRWQRLTRGRWKWLAAGVVALGIVGIAVWALSQFWKTAPAPTSPPLSVAIVPFAAPAGNPADEQFAAALTRDVTLGLGRTRAAHVVSQSAAATYKGKPIDARAFGRELNVRYIVEGEIRRDGERMMVDAQLIDTGNARQAWSGRLELEEARAAQDRSGLLARLTNRLRAALVNAEVARADKLPASDATAIEFWLYGRHVWAKDLASLRGALESRKLYDQALRLDPSLVPALVSKAGTLVYELYFNPRADHDRLVQEMDELSFRAVSIDDQYPPAWDLRGIVLGLQWRWEAALEANAIARRLDPTRDDATITERAELMFFMGRPNEALELVDQALALEPSGVIGISWPLDIRCRANMALGRYDEAIAACEKSVGELDWWMPHLYLIAGYTHTGNVTKAAAEKAKLLQQRPGISIADFKALRLSNDPAFLQQTEAYLFADLRKAGIPEQ